MRTSRTLVLGFTLLMLAPALGVAQQRPIHVNVGGGPVFTLGDIADHFATGWGPAVGVTFGNTFAVQFEYAYHHFNLSDKAPIPTPLATAFSANHTMHQLDFNVVANVTQPGSSVRGYFVMGPGAYRRNVEITKYEGNGLICDPYWFVCGSYPITSVVGSRSSWDFGVNIGGGVGFRIGEEAEFYLETRYHYVWGPDIKAETLPSTTALQGGNANGQYWPLTFGFRF